MPKADSQSRVSELLVYSLGLGLDMPKDEVIGLGSVNGEQGQNNDPKWGISETLEASKICIFLKFFASTTAMAKCVSWVKSVENLAGLCLKRMVRA